jgi:sugar phosphate isomerase/epimerase
MPIGISTLCTFGKTYSVLDEILENDIQVLEILDEWKDRLDKSRMRKLQEIRASRSLRLTVHSPILDMNIASANSRFMNTSVQLVMQSMEHAAEMGAELVVVHPGQHSPLEYLVPRVHLDHNRESLRKIIINGEKLGVRVAVENMPGNTPFLLKKASEFQSLIDEGLPLYMTLDVGHANTTAQLKQFLDNMSGRIIHVHLHDNYGINDDHLVVGKGTVDWGLVRARIDPGKFTCILENNTLDDAKESLLKVRQLFSS